MSGGSAKREYYCDDHPKYNGKRRPTHTACPSCWAVYAKMHVGKMTIEQVERMMNEYRTAVIEQDIM